MDDYYLNLLDWSKSNILAVALRQCVFLWNASTGATQKLLETSGAGNIVRPRPQPAARLPGTARRRLTARG